MSKILRILTALLCVAIILGVMSPANAVTIIGDTHGDGKTAPKKPSPPPTNQGGSSGAGASNPFAWSVSNTYWGSPASGAPSVLSAPTPRAAASQTVSTGSKCAGANQWAAYRGMRTYR